MMRMNVQGIIAIVTCFVSFANAQDKVETCYGAGSIVGAIIGTLVVTLGLLAGCVFLYKMYWKHRKGKNLVLMNDAENAQDQYAFDNPCFREATPIKHNIQDEKQNLKLEKNKWLGWTPLHSFAKEHKNEKVTSMDDSYLNDSRLKVVTLKSHDFTGLGFNICGNMRDGIFVKDVLHRGPAFESGCINSGDRIDSVCINFRNMVFEDALTILSYASPYDVQIQVENDSYSRPSTLIRSKRESNAVSSTERIRHPKYNRSQSISHLNEIGKGNNKKVAHHLEFMQEKNRINQSLNQTPEYNNRSNDYPTIKLSPSVHKNKKENQKLEKNAAPKISPMSGNKKSSHLEHKDDPHNTVTDDSQNKLQKFGIKVLPISVNPKMGVQSMTGTKKPSTPAKSSSMVENEKILVMEKPEKPEKPAKLKSPDVSVSSGSSPEDTPKGESPGTGESEGNKENVKTILTKGFQNLKEKINQNTLGKKKNKEVSNESNVEGETAGSKPSELDNVTVIVKNEVVEKNQLSNEALSTDWPVPKSRSTVACGVKAYEQNQQNHTQVCITVPEEVSRAGDVARNNRKSVVDLTVNSVNKPESTAPTKLKEEKSADSVDGDKTTSKKTEITSDSESSSDHDSFKALDETKKPRKSKGKAPAPPASNTNSNKSGSMSTTPSKQPQIITPKEMNEIKKESELPKENKTNIFEPVQSNSENISLKDDMDNDKSIKSNTDVSYDSDSDAEPGIANSKDKPNNTKIELNATQVTVHQSPSSDINNDDIEPSRKAASLGDLSKLDSEQPLSVVLERAVSLDLADGTTQCGKKRKAPLPPPEEFPAVFDNLSYRKEPRLDNSLGPNTFQRRLKKSSDFGTLEDALCDGPKSLEIEVNKLYSPLDLTETYNSNIQEFSSWLAECRRPKSSTEESSGTESKPTRLSSTSLVNINSTDYLENEGTTEGSKPQYEYQGNNVSFSVNGKNFPDFQVNDKISMDTQNVNFPGANSKTVVVISQPNSLEPTVLETVPVNYFKEDENSQISSPKESTPDSFEKSRVAEGSTTFESFVTSNKSPEKFKMGEDSETPPKLPSSPMPMISTSNTLSSPLSSGFTYITEIKVSTTGRDGNPESMSPKQSDSVINPNGGNTPDQGELESYNLRSSTPIEVNRPEAGSSIMEKIQQFDKPSKDIIAPVKPKPNLNGALAKRDSNEFLKKEPHTVFESSKIPIRTMKSETGQKVLATIQSLAAKESSPPRSSDSEYAKRVASLFSGNSLERNLVNVRKQTEIMENEINRPNISGFYLKSPGTSPPKTSKDFSPTRKIPPVVPPRKTETSLSNKSTIMVELPERNYGPSQTIISEKSLPNESQERNVVTFSSFIPKNKTDDSNNSSLISFNVKDHGEVNGDHLHRHENITPLKTSATQIIFESKDSGDNF